MVAEGTLVGKRYRILTQIGKGGMSTVYLAMDSSLNKQWAVKEIRNVTDPVQRDLVIRSLTVEANMIKRFDHPAIPRIVDLIEEKSSLFVVMDYVEGQTLSALLKKKGAQKEEDVVDWGIQLCDVLDYLHRRKGLTLQEVSRVIAASFWSTIARKEEPARSQETLLRRMFPSLLVTGPFSIIVGFEGGLLALGDRLKLRSMVCAEKGDKAYISSEESAIRKIEPSLDKIYAPAGGEPVIYELYGRRS